MSQQLHNVISNNGLKIKLYIMDCPHHPAMNHFAKNPKYDQDELSENLNDSKFVPYDLYRKRPDEIFYELRNNLFIGYSCLVIVVNSDCKDGWKNLTTALYHIRANKHLRYKSILILSMTAHEKSKPKRRARDIVQNPKGMIISLPRHKPPQLPLPTSTEFKRNLTVFYEELPEYLRKGNLLFYSISSSKGFDMAIIMKSVLQQIYDTPLQSMQEIVARSAVDGNYVCLIMASSLTEFYFFSINPALAIIINQYHFTSNQQSREGSDQDVLRLVRELKVAAIPYILIENCNKQQLLEILNYLRRKDFWPLEKFLFFMMSHGDSDGNIYTTDDKVHIMNDIVKVIQNNESLKTCTQLICMVNCRGKIQADYADFDDFDAIMPTDNSSLHDSTTLLYSVPDQMKSPRSAQHGTPLIASFCKNLRTMSPNDSLKTLIHNVNKNLKDFQYYRCFANNSVEFVCKDTAANQSIKTIPKGAINMIRLLLSIATEMEKILGSGNDSSVMIKSVFYIAGNLCKNQMELNPWEKKYFSPQLNNDRCELVEEFEEISADESPEYIDNEFV